MLFGAVFALAFGGGGLYLGLLPLVRTAHSAWEVTSWQAVPAEVLSSKLVSNRSSDGTTHMVQARYRYTAGGRTHESTRVGLDPTPGSDNIGNWHQQWHARLSKAREGGQMVTAWVDPTDPSRSVLERDIRWTMAIFRLPFALVFTGVGLGALWVFWRALLGWGSTSTKAGVVRGGNTATTSASNLNGQVVLSSASRGQGLLWLFALFWGGIAFPMAALMWMTATQWWPKAFMLIFVAVGIFLFSLAWRQSALAWRFAGARVRYVPGAPVAGEVFEVELAMPRRALERALPAGRRLRIAQYRVDDSGSGTQERQVEAFEQVAGVLPDMADGERWQASFELPADAPTHGGRRSGERVDWRLEILKPDGAVEVFYDIPVQARMETTAAHGDAVPDRFDQRTVWGQEYAIPVRGAGGTFGESAMPLPDTVQVLESADAWEMLFRQSGWRWASVVAGVAAAMLAGLWWKAAPGNTWMDAVGSVTWWGAALLLLLAVHASTRQWRLRVRDDGLEREVASWIWRRSQSLGLGSLDLLFSKLFFTQTSGQNTTSFHALHARETANGRGMRLTPGLPGEASAMAVAQALRAASAHRGGRFTPGVLRQPTAVPWRVLAGWLVWALMLLLLAVVPLLVPWPW
jgi:hypothetical protein